MSELRKIGIITSGGDCGGLNAVVKGTAQMARRLKIETVVIPNGYAGLYNLVDFEKLITLNPQRLDLFDASIAGSEAGHSRVKISKIDDALKYARIKEGLKKFSIDALVISGGDDTGSVVVDLKGHGIATVHIPKTMDLDLQSYSVGGDSTINRIASFVVDLKTTGRTHNRIMIVEVFGRYAGHTALHAAATADADCALIPEIPVDLDYVYQDMKETFIRRVRTSDVNSGTYLIVVSEGITDAKGEQITDDMAGIDAFGHKKLAGAGKFVRYELTKRMKNDESMTDFMKEQGMYVKGLYEFPEVREVTPGHLVRSGRSTAIDVNFGKESGAASVLLLKKGITGVTVIGVEKNEIRYMQTEDVIKHRQVSQETIRLHESLGLCFGRKPVTFEPQFVEVKGYIERIY